MRSLIRKDIRPKEEVEEEYDTPKEEKELTPSTRESRFIRIWKWFSFSVLTSFFKNYAVLRRESQLFLGASLFVIGFFGFESGKYCDGNTSEYLSCTRPSTYYYYDTLHIILIIVGVSLIMLWYLRRTRATRSE